MNNNRGGNNRRRGRGNNNTRPQGTGGGQQVNRIDSRARGNAPQMLEKYRKLANDAHLNGDRVNAEYNLQFADHYFRVIADTRVRQEEQRLRRDDRWQEGGEGGSDENDDAGEFGVENEFPAFDQPPVYTRRDRDDRPERTPEGTAERAPAERAPAERSQDRPVAQPDYRRRDERSAHDGSNDRQSPRGNGWDAEPSRPQVGSDDRAAAGRGWTGDAGEPAAKVEANDSAAAYEPRENAMLRENRGGRGLRPRREDRRPRREDRPEVAAADEAPIAPVTAPASADEGQIATDRVKPATREARTTGRGRPANREAQVQAALGNSQDPDRSVRALSAGIDPDSLPPAFTVSRDEPAFATDQAPAPAPAPRRRAKRKPAADDTGEPIQSLI